MKKVLADLLKLYNEKYSDIELDSFGMILIHCGCTFISNVNENIYNEIETLFEDDQ